MAPALEFPVGALRDILPSALQAQQPLPHRHRECRSGHNEDARVQGGRRGASELDKPRYALARRHTQDTGKQQTRGVDDARPVAGFVHMSLCTQLPRIRKTVRQLSAAARRRVEERPLGCRVAPQETDTEQAQHALRDVQQMARRQGEEERTAHGTEDTEHPQPH